MVKPRKTRKAVEESPAIEDLIEDEEEEEEVQEYTPPPPAKTQPPKVLPKQAAPKEFTAILQEATSLTLAGIKFLKNEPTKVPMAHLKMIRDHGWFRVSV